MIRLQVIPSQRKREFFANPVTSWTFRIFTGPRCKGFIYNGNYKSYESALKAGINRVKRLGLSLSDGGF